MSNLHGFTSTHMTLLQAEDSFFEKKNNEISEGSSMESWLSDHQENVLQVQSTAAALLTILSPPCHPTCL